MEGSSRGAHLRSCRQCRPRAISYATFLPRNFHWKMRCPALLVRGSWSHSVPFSMKSMARMVFPCVQACVHFKLL